ncbi:MAG: universal stress protein [Sphingobacteriia bacterium]|nr:universal stress protein [Sphingobacteriia bacterium]NCC39848.1 universal stress protein [Gammaproteobacteria bacterium]
MSSETQRRPVRRIAVALDATPHSLGGLALVAGIAAALNAEIEGVFVEDTELIRLAGLPFLREFRAVTRGESLLDAERLQRELRAAARQVRAQLERSATELGIAWSFRIWRGDLEAEILGAAHDAELFALGRLGRFAPLARRAPSRAARGRTTDPLVGVLYDGGEGAERVLAIAAELMMRHPVKLIILLQPHHPEEAPALHRRAAEQLGTIAEQVRMVTLAQDQPEDLAATVRGCAIDLLILAAHNPILSQTQVWTSLEHLGCPLVIGR